MIEMTKLLDMDVAVLRVNCANSGTMGYRGSPSIIATRKRNSGIGSRWTCDMDIVNIDTIAWIRVLTCTQYQRATIHSIGSKYSSLKFKGTKHLSLKDTFEYPTTGNVTNSTMRARSS